MRRKVEVSDHPLVERIRDWFAIGSGAFGETEQAHIIRALQTVDPSFRMDTFLKDMAEYTIPDIMEAYLRADGAALKPWCSERAFARFHAGFEAQRAANVKSDCQLLDIRRVDLSKAILLEDELPVLGLTFSTHEILVYRNKKGEVVMGDEDRIETANYMVILTKAQLVDPSIPHNPETRDWMIIDWGRTAL
ncbi:mitochondrial import inner membrane translocase, subunit Tim44 [Caulochytrium protostelioides]|uniref:Mitochondrial import inner membrane translocase, subunit Tim44 n=1 Tax=Caulochytrium protostelioides TaxID=1555241 RepID=A0A4P9WQ99_9FUNG|nr:mitochondrial import inner membrane translocase, subunit Tim44 [Caulochytrium protostelioides]